MNKRPGSPWLVLLLAALGLIALASSPLVAPALGDGSKKRKLSHRQWKKLMNRWKRELGGDIEGVKCSYCHVRPPEGEDPDWEKDTPHKVIARYCDEHFVENLQTKDGKPVSCQTCHQRKPRFLPRPKEEGKQEGER